MHVNLSRIEFLKLTPGNKILFEIQAEIACGTITSLFSMAVRGNHHYSGHQRAAGICPKGFFLDT
jgi:hypothetical protein